jgi:hypothetical protein
MTPIRVLDTRAPGVAVSTPAPLGPGAIINLPLTTAAPNRPGVPVPASAFSVLRRLRAIGTVGSLGFFGSVGSIGTVGTERRLGSVGTVGTERAFRPQRPRRHPDAVLLQHRGLRRSGHGVHNRRHHDSSERRAIPRVG